jgi:hypothetical protein
MLTKGHRSPRSAGFPFFIGDHRRRLDASIFRKKLCEKWALRDGRRGTVSLQ